MTLSIRLTPEKRAALRQERLLQLDPEAKKLLEHKGMSETLMISIAGLTKFNQLAFARAIDKEKVDALALLKVLTSPQSPSYRKRIFALCGARFPDKP